MPQQRPQLQLKNWVVMERWQKSAAAAVNGAPIADGAVQIDADDQHHWSCHTGEQEATTAVDVVQLIVAAAVDDGNENDDQKQEHC